MMTASASSSIKWDIWLFGFVDFIIIALSKKLISPGKKGKGLRQNDEGKEKKQK
jgi:energy-converting hydrogenase Eha subunit G